MNENSSVVIMYGATPCHVGSGSSLGVVDSPIQREKHTNWPVIQASGMKGSLRSAFDKYKNKISEINRNQVNDFDKLTESIFGSEDAGGYAGSLSISDVKILAYPMRSSIAPFVWITCPSVLKRFERDLSLSNKIKNKVDLVEIEKKLSSSKNALIVFGNITGDVLLEDFQVEAVKDDVTNKISEITTYLKSAERLLIVSDEVFNYGVTDCTQIMAQIKINSETGTTQDGSLRYQEELPSDTIMYSVLLWNDSKNKTEDKLKSETIKGFITKEVIPEYIQVGGDETCGRGIFELCWN